MPAVSFSAVSLLQIAARGSSHKHKTTSCGSSVEHFHGNTRGSYLNVVDSKIIQFIEKRNENVRVCDLDLVQCAMTRTSMYLCLLYREHAHLGRNT